MLTFSVVWGAAAVVLIVSLPLFSADELDQLAGLFSNVIYTMHLIAQNYQVPQGPVLVGTAIGLVGVFVSVGVLFDTNVDPGPWRLITCFLTFRCC